MARQKDGQPLQRVSMGLVGTARKKIPTVRTDVETVIEQISWEDSKNIPSPEFVNRIFHQCDKVILEYMSQYFKLVNKNITKQLVLDVKKIEKAGERVITCYKEGNLIAFKKFGYALLTAINNKNKMYNILCVEGEKTIYANSREIKEITAYKMPKAMPSKGQEKIDYNTQTPEYTESDGDYVDIFQTRLILSGSFGSGKKR